MPRFAANLTMMFNEVPFLDRFDAAAKAGFTAVEFLFPYEHPTKEVGERLKSAGLTQALFNLPPGDWAAGEKGFAALPARFADLQESLRTALPRRPPEYRGLGYGGTSPTSLLGTHPVRLSLPTIPASVAPSLMSVSRARPRHITILPGGGSLARAR